MADAFCNQFNDPKFEEIPFEDRFAMLVDIEYSNQKNNRLKRLIHNAGFDPPDVNIMDINYTSGRKLNKNLISRLATCKYISKHRNLFITGATGCGKTYMACALAWKHVSDISLQDMSAFQICLLIWRLPGQKETTEKSWLNMLIHWCSFSMNGFF